MARRVRKGGMEGSIAKELDKRITRATARGIQEFAINTMNSLAKAGPTWSGEFSASWRFVPEGSDPGGPGQEGKVYSYGKKDIRVTTIEKHMRAGARSGNKRFQIVNTAPHANLAIDAEIGVFRRDAAEARGWPEPLAEKPKLKLGDERSNPGLRFEIGAPFDGSFDEAPASMTAEPDWYYTYILGGGLEKDLGRGFSAGFKESF